MNPSNRQDTPKEDGSATNTGEVFEVGPRKKVWLSNPPMPAQYVTEGAPKGHMRRADQPLNNQESLKTCPHCGVPVESENQYLNHVLLRHKESSDAWLYELFYMLNKHVKYALTPEQMLDLERRQDAVKTAIKHRIALAQQEAEQNVLLSEIEKYDALDQQKFFAGLFYRWCMATTNATRVTIKLHDFSVDGDVKGNLEIVGELNTTSSKEKTS